MAQRETISAVNVDNLRALLKHKGWSGSYFCETLMGKSRGWFSEWVRKDKCGNVTPKNLPSPEEAAKMCLLLNATPEEILLEKGETDEETAKLQADIALVNGLIEQEREKQGIKKDPAVGEVSKAKQNLIDIVSRLSDEQCIKLQGIIDEALKLL